MNFPIRFKILFLCALAVIFNIITFFLVYFKVSSEKGEFALKYNIISGVEWYGKGYNLYFFPILGIIVTAMNFVLFKYLEKNKVVFLKELAIFATIVFQFILLLATFFLMKIN